MGERKGVVGGEIGRREGEKEGEDGRSEEGSKEDRKKNGEKLHVHTGCTHTSCTIIQAGTLHDIITQNATLGTTQMYTALLNAITLSNLFKLCFLFLEFFLEHLEVVVLR